jgi:hypothetical protein
VIYTEAAKDCIVDSAANFKTEMKTAMNAKLTEKVANGAPALGGQYDFSEITLSSVQETVTTVDSVAQTTSSSGSSSSSSGDDSGSSSAFTTIIDVPWDYVEDSKIPNAVYAEYKMVSCPLNGKIRFLWPKTREHTHTNTFGETETKTVMHDLWQLGTEADYTQCNFQSGTSNLLVESDGTGTMSSGSSDVGNVEYLYPCSTLGTHFFACSLDNACAEKKPKDRDSRPGLVGY